MKAPFAVEGEKLGDAALGHDVQGHDPAARPFADSGGKMQELPGRSVVGDKAGEKARAFAASVALPPRSRRPVW